MELQEAMKKRRSIRKYQPRDVEDQLLEELFEAARISPSAKNRQPWRFMVLKGSEKDHVADIMEGWFADSTHEIPRYAKSSKYTAGTVREAPVLILVGGLAVGYAAEVPEERPRISREEFMLSAKFEQDSV